MAKDKADKLAALKERLSQEKLSSGRGTEWFNPEEGTNQIRIMPQVGDMEWFYQIVGIHYLPDGRRVYCPQVISEGEYPCPLCELVNQLYNAGDDKFAGKIRVSRKWWMNVIDRNDEQTGPKVYGAPKTVFAGIVALINDPEYGLVMDPYEGVDIVVEKTKTGSEAWDVDYQVIPRRISTPLAFEGSGKNVEPDEETIEEWLSQAKELTWGELTMDPEEDMEVNRQYGIVFQPYDRIVQEVLGDITGDEDFQEAEEIDEEEIEDEEPEEEEAPAKEEVKTRRARRARRRRAAK